MMEIVEDKQQIQKQQKTVYRLHLFQHNCDK